MALIPERRDPDPMQEGGSLLVLAPLAFVLGGTSGLVGALFRMALEWSDRRRGSTIDWSHRHGLVGFVTPARDFGRRHGFGCASGPEIRAAGKRERHPKCRGRAARRATRTVRFF